MASGPCMRLGSLTTLRLNIPAVHLPNLLCIAHQLHMLSLQQTLATGAHSDTFAAGWTSLRQLYLCDLDVDAPFGAVHLPSLELLSLWDLRIGDGEEEGAEYACTAQFAAGCPNCTSLQYSQPLPVSPAAGLLCRDFSSRLREPRLILEPSQMQHMSGCDWPALPTAATNLTIRKRESIGYPRDRGDEYFTKSLDLFAMLAAAAAWISAGAPLQRLQLHDCVPCAQSDFEPADEQQQQPVAGRYATVSALLRGVTRVDLSCGYGTVHVLNAVVAGLPDVKLLSLELGEAGLCADTPILCSGLESLELYDWPVWREALHISLSDPSSLRTCTLKMSHGQHGRGGCACAHRRSRCRGKQRAQCGRG